MKQPVLSERGDDSFDFYELAVEGVWNKLTITGDIRYDQFKWKRKTPTGYISHGNTIHPGSEVDAKTLFIHYGIAAQYRFGITERISVSPKLGGNLTSFSYKYSASLASNRYIKNDRREFHAMSFTGGVDVDLRLAQKLKATLEADFALPLNTHVRKNDTIGLIFTWNVAGSENSGLDILFGAEKRTFEFKDKQTFPNHMRLNGKINWKIGLQYRF